MVLRFVLWNLADSQTTLDEIRAAGFPDNGNETWFSDEGSERLGAFAAFPDAEAAAAPIDESLRELIGKDPDVLELFDVES